MTATASDALVLTERRGLVEILTLNRPDKRNALNAELREALILALQRAAPETRAFVITGAGDRAFVAGADVAEFRDRSVADQARTMLGSRVYDVVAAVPQPVVAAINGACLGGGLELALACDIRVASSTARLGQPEVGLGIIPGGGATQRLPRVIGSGAALRLILTADPVDASEALRLGLVDEVVDPSECLPRAIAIAERISRNSPIAVAAAKSVTRAALGLPLGAGLDLERAAFLATFGGEDRIEGVSAFLEKRRAEFGRRPPIT
ncbi:MAG: enoyl-CoA hydratase/isomerase family protein [Gemmatimonadales bacterium]|nr:enoyl-CoA hydratase/isomerase family protein [Gemmatimonadales bacterium]